MRAETRAAQTASVDAPLVRKLEPLVGAPVSLEEVTPLSGPARTYRAQGSRRAAIAKVYPDGRAREVAARVSSLGDGPTEPRAPEVLSAEDDELVVLTELEGTPLREAALAGDGSACRRAGETLGAWHQFWRNRIPEAIPVHSYERELELLEALAVQASEPVRGAVRFALEAVREDRGWKPDTVVHRDLTDESVLLGDVIGLVDVDSAVAGPPELDVANVCAHIELLERRHRRSLHAMQRAFLDGYLSGGAPLDLPLLLRSRSLGLLRLACIHHSDELAAAYVGTAWPPP
jgi:Ser/Thr protein kinase RdoA (MazF antagonist)